MEDHQAVDVVSIISPNENINDVTLRPQSDISKRSTLLCPGQVKLTHCPSRARSAGSSSLAGRRVLHVHMRRNSHYLLLQAVHPLQHLYCCIMRSAIDDLADICAQGIASYSDATQRVWMHSTAQPNA